MYLLKIIIMISLYISNQLMSSVTSASTGLNATQNITKNKVVPIHNDDTRLLETKPIMLVPMVQA